MKKNFVAAFVVALIVSGIVQVAVADDDYYGIVESRPDGKVGTWIVGGLSVEVTERTDLDEENGPLKIGACAEVDTDEGKVEEIESEPAGKCSR
jgi:hypothetical protein